MLTTLWTIRWLWSPFQANPVQGTPNNLLLLHLFNIASLAQDPWLKFILTEATT